MSAESASPSFVHLRVHTEYSLVDGIVRIKPLARAVADAGMPAVALTDQCNMFALVKFYRACLDQGVKPVFGADLWLENEEREGRPFSLVLLCRNQRGYRNLTELVSLAYTDGQQRGVPMIRRDWLEGRGEGLIALSGGRLGDVGQALLADNMDLAHDRMAFWLRLFGDAFYLELQRTGRPDEEDYLHAAVELAGVCQVPVVATNDVRFIREDEFEAHEVRVCIHDGRTLDDPRRPRLYSEQQYLRSPAEMASLFEDIPEALENSVEIARRCNVSLELGKNYLPEFPIPAGLTIEEYFTQLSRQGLEERLRKLFDSEAPDFDDRRRPYDERLQAELDVINQMGFPGYFLIVADFIQWAKNHGVPVGPGRGSGAGSLVAYALQITDLDPLEYDLLFERFLNPERVSMPDFDVDFCMEGRDRVIDYVAERYGRDKVSQIITYGTMAAKAVVRDVGRVMGHPYGFVDRIAKLIPFEVGMTLDKALKQEEELRRVYQEEEEVATLIDMARSLEGIARNAGKHAGGVVIAPTRLTDFSPLYCEQGSAGIVTQFDKNDIEAVGLVKFDFLGLRTLTIIDWALDNIRDRIRIRGGDPEAECPDIGRIPLDDRASFEQLQAGNTTAVFQLESRGMKELIKRLQPDCFEDIIALVALFRPGPLQSGMVDNFIDRKHGREAVSYPDAQYQHECLKPILEPTYGIILYQEQVMQIAQVLAGYTLGGADLLRRAMGKKKPEEMAKQRAVFEEGARRNGIDGELAMKIFNLVEKFAGYGFNKSHSAAYALVSYQTMWLKTHYPAEFMAAVLSADMDNTDKVVTLIEECRGMGLEVAPPDVNLSRYAFTVDASGSIVYGLGAIKGVGEGAIEGIVEERGQGGPFHDLFDFCRRIDLRKVNRRVLEAMTRAGALDALGPNRATLMAHLPEALKAAEQALRNAEAGMADLFGGPAEVAAMPAPEAALPEWDDEQRLLGEKETLGLYLTGHPIDRYRDELDHIVSGPIARFAEAEELPTRQQDEKPVTLAGLVVDIRVLNTQRGRMAIITLDDRTARIDVMFFDNAFQRFQHVLIKDQVVVVEGGVRRDDYRGGTRVSARQVYSMDEAREAFARRLLISLDSAQAGNERLRRLAETLKPYCEGACPITIDYRRSGARGQIDLGENWRVHPADELLHRLRRLMGEQAVAPVYR